MQEPKLLPFIDEDGRIKAWPSKQAKKLIVLAYLSQKFDIGRVYTEREVNSIIERWHTMGDLFLLRRELVEAGFFTRTPSGSEYRRCMKEC